MHLSIISLFLLVDGCPGRSSLSTDICPSLELQNHSNFHTAQGMFSKKTMTKINAQSLFSFLSHSKCDKTNSPAVYLVSHETERSYSEATEYE
jgi:hypothetical protein